MIETLEKGVNMLKVNNKNIGTTWKCRSSVFIVSIVDVK